MRHRRLSVPRAGPVAMALALWLGMSGISLADDDLRVAVATNFARTLGDIASAYTEKTGNKVGLSSASTGTLYAQINQGAPFDLFFAADQARPDKLVATGKAVADSRFIYARGVLALYSADLPLDPDPARTLIEGDYAPIAIADRKTAPYGAAAVAVLEALEARESVASRLIYGKNIGQTFQYVATGHAAIGFVALSQLRDPDNPLRGRGHVWPVPASMHPPLDQAAVILERSPRKSAARDFIDFLRSDIGRAIIERYGYTLPGARPS